jgi:hypothetical protein
MQFKRSEGFRYEFKTPLAANFKIMTNGRFESLDQPMHSCTILDISPRGMKMFSQANFGEHTNNVLQLEIHFILDETAIQAVGNIVWEKPYAGGKQFGLIFMNQPKLEDLIVSELKSRRRKEIANKK